MKKINLFAVVFIGIMIASPISATSGACSSHDGVNCALIGKVYCNDGYSDSTANYFEMEECKNYKFSCGIEKWQELINTEEIIKTKQKLNEINLSIIKTTEELKKYDTQTSVGFNGISDQTIPTGLLIGQSASYQRERNTGRNAIISELKSKANSLQLYNLTLISEINITKTKCENIGKQNAVLQYAKSLQEEIKKTEETSEIKKQETTNLLNLIYHKYICPANSTLNGTKCSCNNGYVFNEKITSSSCITYNQSCQSIYGGNSYGDSDGCHTCPSEYNLDISTKICVLKIATPVKLTREQILIKIKEITALILKLQGQLNLIK